VISDEEGSFVGLTQTNLEQNKKALCWEFKTEGKDVGFCVLLRANGNDKQLSEYRRYESHINRVKV